MSHTIEEAKKKFCPITQGMNNCVGDGCMMWRWKEKREIAVKYPIGEPLYKIVDPTHGYCGMAGKPEATKK